MPVLTRSTPRLLAVALGAAGMLLVACSSSASEPAPSETAAVETPTPAVEATATPGNDGAARVAADGDSVTVHYHGTLDDGEVFDSSRERSPLPFVVGRGDVISGFDDAVRGLSVGESVTVRIPRAEAYGPVDPARVLEFPIEQVPEGLEVGDQVSVSGAPATVTAITEDTVTVDANHPLAGLALTFEIELVSIE